MGDQYTVDSQALQQAAARTEDSANIIKGIESRLGGYKSSLMSGWEGEAAQAFKLAFDSFESDLGDMREVLEGMYEQLTDTELTYESTEQEQKEAVNKIHELLNGGA